MEFEDSLEGLKQHEIHLIKKVADLERMEDQFSQCVALIPESGEGVKKILKELEDLN